MSKNVQIPTELFLRLIRYHYLGDDSPELPGEITKALEIKLDAMAKHALYSTYQNKQLSPKEREQARQEYLNKVGMRESFRWSENWDSKPPDISS